mgnify:CR=1 FL=1
MAKKNNIPEVDIVVETMGGVHPALEFSSRALACGKHVVTSNKELVATHGYDLLQLAKANGVKVGAMMFPLRMALTGCHAGPGIDVVMQSLGRDEVLRRIEIFPC